MAFTYEWEITGLKTTDQLNMEGDVLPVSVCQTYWKLTGTDTNGNTGSFAGATPFCAKNHTLADFQAFETLSEADVLAWIQDIVNNDIGYKDHIDSQIQKQIDAVTITDAPLPWTPTEPAPE